MDNAIETKSTFWNKFLYIIYGVFCVLLFSYLLFPYYALKPKFEDALSKVTDMSVSINAIKPALPIGWTMVGLNISDEHALDSLTLKPKILPLFAGRFALGVKMTEGNGLLKGRLGTTFFKIGNRIDVELSMKKFELSVIRHFSKKLDELSGTASGDVDVTYIRNQPERSEGEINLLVENGQIPLNIQSFPVAAIPFSKFELKANMDDGLLKISKADLTGNDVSGNMRGDVKMGGSLDASDLNLVAGLRLSPAYRSFLGSSGNENVRIVVGGKLGSPRTTFN
jgi:type II secretion system protein N